MTDEQKWLRKMQRVLNECPPTLGFYTVGDPSVGVYDRTKEAAINARHEREDVEFCGAVEDCDAFVAFLNFTAPVHSTAG